MPFCHHFIFLASCSVSGSKQTSLCKKNHLLVIYWIFFKKMGSISWVPQDKSIVLFFMSGQILCFFGGHLWIGICQMYDVAPLSIPIFNHKWNYYWLISTRHNRCVPSVHILPPPSFGSVGDIFNFLVKFLI